METGILTTVVVAALLAELPHQRRDRRGSHLPQLDPYSDQYMNLTTALTESCDTYFYGSATVLFASAGDGHPLQDWASRSVSASRPG